MLYQTSNRVLHMQPTPDGWCFDLEGVLFLALSGLLRRNPQFFNHLTPLTPPESRPAQDVISDVYMAVGDPPEGQVEVCVLPCASVACSASPPCCPQQP